MGEREGRRRPTRASRPSADPVQTALEFALEAHLGQARKDGRTAYIVHPVAVMRVLSSELGVTDPEILCAALLHDVVEDTPVTLGRLRSRFGPRVTRWVEELTLPSETHGPSVPDSVKTKLLVEAVGRITWPAVLVKLADRVDNLRDIANARWSDRKRRAFQEQTRRILRTVAQRIKSDPPDFALEKPLRHARRLVLDELR